MRKPVIAIAGATGLVGSEMMQCLVQLGIRFSEVRLLASKDSAGELYKVGDEEVQVQVLDGDSFEGCDVALFATSSELSEKYVPIAVEAGALVIDNSSFFRTDPNVPLVIPEVNFKTVRPEHRIIANPNCAAAQIVPVLNVLHKAAGLKRVVVTTFQSVSGAGKAALDELWQQTLAICNQTGVQNEVFPHQIAFNCIPQIDRFLDSGYTKEEDKIMHETRKILGLPSLDITATAVRVPVFHSHAASMNVELERELSTEECVKLLGAAQGIEVRGDADEYPLQIDVTGQDPIFVGRVRRDVSVPHGLAMWVVADNLRKGAALNAVQILECYLATFAHDA